MNENEQQVPARGPITVSSVQVSTQSTSGKTEAAHISADLGTVYWTWVTAEGDNVVTASVERMRGASSARL